MSVNYPGSDARIRLLAELVRQGKPLFDAALPTLPDNVGYQIVTSGNGTVIGCRFIEQGPHGRRVIEEPQPEKAGRGARYPCEERYRRDLRHKARETARYKARLRRNPKFIQRHEERRRKWLELVEIFLAPTGQWYLWEWRRSRRRADPKRPKKTPRTKRTDGKIKPKSKKKRPKKAK